MSGKPAAETVVALASKMRNRRASTPPVLPWDDPQRSDPLPRWLQTVASVTSLAGAIPAPSLP